MRRIALLLALSACTSPAQSNAHNGTPDAGADAGDGGAVLDGPALLGGLDCDPLVPTECGYPFPSNVYLVDDATTVTRKAVRFGKATLPVVYGGGHMDQ